MEENSKVYRIRTKVGEDSPNVIHVPINQTYDTFEILSLKLNQTDTYKTYESGYGIIVGRVIANGGFGVPNSKVSVFIEVDDNESLKDTLLYNFTSTSDTDNDGVRYNLLPDYVEAECHQDVGTFPNKRLVLDNDDVIEIFDKYWKYTTTTNNSGDYMLFGIPTGSQQLHVDIDLSDCGVLSQRPHNMIGKGYDIGMFESPNKFKSSTNLNSLPQIVTEDRGVYVYPYWGDTSNGDNTFAITRCDINIEYKFEPTAVFMGSIITDKGSNAIGKNCTATINNGKMSELVTGEGTIEMIRKTIDGRVEQFPIMGNRLIDGDGTWVYEIPMNLDYVTTDEFGNFVPTDNPDKGIATRARVRFRVRLDDTQYDNTARKRACYLIPNNPRLEDEGFDKTMEVDYEFGSLTREESYRDLFWNKVYTVKSYIPKIQKGDEQYNRQHTGIKWVNHANQNNPMPYNTLTVKLSFVHRIICILTGLVVQFVAFINQIISLLGFIFATLFDLPSVIFNGLARLLEDTICLPWPLSGVCVGDLLAQIFYGIGKGLSSINILGRMATKFLTPKCIVLDSGFCDDNVNKIDFYPGCGYFLFNLFPLSSATDVVERGDIAWEKTQEAQQEEYNGKSSDEVRTASNHTGELHNCYENALAQENEATSFNFNNDWINGTLYAPLWYRKITPKKRFFFGLFSRKAKDEWCTSKQYFPSLRYIQHCAVERDGSKTITNFDGDTTDLKFVRNSECEDGDCHERHVALPGLGGVIHSKQTMLGQDVYYYKPVEWSANLPSNELYKGKKKGELKLLFATDIVLLGSLDSCDMNGIPQFFKNLESTTYNMPGDILFTDYEFHYIIDPETGNATSNYNTQDYTVHSEMAGCDWGNPNEFNRSDGGLFYGIGCTNGETELYAKSCVNLSRICEYGVSLDVTKQIPLLDKWKDETSESEIEQAEDGTYYKRLITDGYISWDELYNLDERSMFATMNGNQLKTKINTKNGLKEYDFRYLYPENFDGSLAERMKRRTQNYPPEVNYKFNYLLEKASRDYYLFRMGNKPYYYDSNNAFPRYENSFYFYFGLNEGKTAIEKFNSKYFAECDNEKGVYNNFNIYKKSSSWCSSLNNTYDGFIALDLEKIATPYSIVITGDNTFTLDDIRDEKIIFYNDKIYSIPEGFEDYVPKVFEEFKEVEDENKNIFIPNGAYYVTITDANEEEYHYELDMSYNFLMYSNNVQSFKKNHEDLLRSLGTNNAIMNDNTKLVYSNPEKIEREIGGVITVYGVHDNDGDIEHYKIEVREKVDFDKTDIQKTIEKEGDTWYDADGNLYKVTSIDDDGTIHYTKNGIVYTDKKKGDTVEDYDRMKKELIVPEWYDKDAEKHYLSEKEEGTQQADFNPLVKKHLNVGDTWYDVDGYFCEVTSIVPPGEEVITAEKWSTLTPIEKEWYEVYEYVNRDDEEDIITKDVWEGLSEEQRANYKPHTYVNKINIIHYTKKNVEGDFIIGGRNTVVDYTDWTLEMNLPTYYNKNGEKQYYPYQPNKETSVVDFELSDRLKKLKEVGDTWYDEEGNVYKVTSVVNGKIHYTINDKGDYTIDGDTWYDVDGYFCEVTSIVPPGEEVITAEKWSTLTPIEKEWYDEYEYVNKVTIIHYTKKNVEGDFIIGGRNTVVDYSDWVLELTPPTWYDLDGNFCEVISIEGNTIHYTKNGEGNYTDKKIGDTVTEVTFNSSLENAPYLEYLYNLYKGDEYVEKYDLVGSDGVEYGIGYKVISPYALTSDDYIKLTEFGKFDYEQIYVNKQDSGTITIEVYNRLPDGYSQKSYDVYQYVNKQNVEDIITKEQWEDLSEEQRDNYKPYTYVNKYDATIITSEDWDDLPKYCKRDYDKKYRNKQKSSDIIDPEEYNELPDGYGKNHYKTEITYCKIENKTEYITKEEYDDNVDIQFLYQQFHVLIENKNNILIENVCDKTLKEEDYTKIIVNYNAFKKDLDSENKTDISFYTKKGVSKECKYDSTDERWKCDEIDIIGNYIIDYQKLKEVKASGDVYYDYEGNQQPVNQTETVIDFASLVRVLSFETWLDEDGALCEVTSVADGTIHYSKNGEEEDEKGNPYIIEDRDTVINYNQPIWTKTTRSDDNYSWVDKNGVTQYAGAETLVVDYSWLLETTTQEEIVWYDKEGNVYKVTEIEGGIIHYTKNGEGVDTVKNLGDIVVDFNHDSFILILDDIDDAWYDEDGNFCEVTSIMPPGEEVITAVEWDSLTDKKEWYEVYEYVNNTDASIIISKEKWESLSEDQRANYKPHTYVNKIIIYYTKNGEEKDEYNNPYIIVGRDSVVNYYKFMTEPLYLPTWYDADGNLYKVTSIDTDGKIHYTKNGEKKDEEGNPYIIVGRDTVVDWSEYIGYEGAEITYDNGVITNITNVLWYDSEKQSFAFGVPDENRTYIITVTQICDGRDTSNEIKTNVFVSGVIKYKMFINGIDYEIIKNFDGHTGWSYNGTITKNKLTTNVSDLNENNPWFNVDKIYYHNNFGGSENDTYPQINLKDIERFGIDKNESEQTYAIYATEIDKEDEEVGKKVNETYHGEDGKNKTVKANDVRATFVEKRNEDDVTTYKVIDFTVKKLTVVGDTWYDADGNLCKVTSVVPQGKEVISADEWSALAPTQQEWYDEVYVNKQDSSVILPEAYNQLPEYNQDCYDEVYVKNDGTDTRSKEQWEELDLDERANYHKKYMNKYHETDIITPDEWVELSTGYCKRDYAKMYRNKYVIIHYTKNGGGDYRGRVAWYDADGVLYEVTSVVDGIIHYTKNGDGDYTDKKVGDTVVDYSNWVTELKIRELKITEQQADSIQYVNKQVSTDFKTTERYNQLHDGYSRKSYDAYQYVNKQNVKDIITKAEWEDLSEEQRANYEPHTYINKYNETDIISSEDWDNLSPDYCKGDYEAFEKYFKQYRNKEVSTEFISSETYKRLPEYNQKSYDVYQYVNKQNMKDIITKAQWEDLSEVERDNYKPYTYVNRYKPSDIISSEDWTKLPKYCQEDYTQVYLSTWYDKNGTLNYMLPSEQGQKRIDFRPLVKEIEKEGETWYDVNSVKRVAGSDDIGQEVLDYSKENNGLTQLKEIDFKTDDKTWHDKNGIENVADSDKLGLYIDMTYMTKGGDTTLFNIYNEEYIDKLVIDKVEVDKVVIDKVQLDKYANKQVSNNIIDVNTYNQLPDYNKDCYDEVYVKENDEETIIFTKEQWETLDPEEWANYIKKYKNKYDTTIITPDDWDALSSDYCKRDYIEAYTYQYNFNRKGLHSVRIYLTLQEQETETPYKELLSDVIDFNGCSDLNTIVLPNIGITTIGDSAFNGCKSLTSIDLPDSITAIGANAFNGCEKLSSVYIPYNVTKISNSAFNGCKSLTNIVLPKNITTIGNSAFANCEKLQSVRAEMKDVTNTTVASNAFDNTNIGLIIYVPMDKDGKLYDDSTTPYNKAGWGDDVQDKVVAIELTVFNYNKVNINPSDLLDEFARNTGDNKVYYNFIDTYVASEYKAFTQVTYFKASDFVNAINNVLSRRREIADRMFNTFYMTQEGESKSFNITSNTDEMPVQPIIVYHEEEIDDVDIDYTLTTPNLVYGQTNTLKNVNIPTITYKSSPFFGDGTSSDEIMITKSNNIEKKPSSTGIMNVKQKSIPLDSGNKDFPSISLSGGVKAINPSKTNIVDLFEFPVIDKIESSSVSGWTKFSNIPSPNPNNIGMINMDGYVYGRHNNGVVERDGNFEIRKLGKYEINLSGNLNGNVENSTKPYTYAERRVITGLTNYSIAQWCIVKLRNIVQADDVTEETLKNIWKMLFNNPTNEEDEPPYVKEKLLEVIDTMTVLKQTIDDELIIYIQCDETIDVVKNQWIIDQSEDDYITNNLIQFKKFNVVDIDNERQYAFTDAKKANLNIGEINENFNFDNELKLSTEAESIDTSGQSLFITNLMKLSFNQGEKEGGHYQLFGLSRYRDGFYGNEDMNQYPLYNAAKNGIVCQIDEVQKETMLSHEGEITKINNKEKQIQGTFNEEYHSSYFHSMYKFKGSNDDERVWRDAESTNGLYIGNKGFNCNEAIFWTVSNDYFLNPKYIRHVYCVYVKGNMKMLSPLYEFAPTQLVGTCGNLYSYDDDEGKTESVIGIKVNNYARVYFKNYDYTLGGPFKIKRKKFYIYDYLTHIIPEGTIKYKDEEYYYMRVDKLEDGIYEFEDNMTLQKQQYDNFHKDHVIAKDITDLRHLTWTNGNELKRDKFILIKWVVPESDSFRFISEQKDPETEDFVESITVEKVYREGQTLTRLPKNNGQHYNDKWTIKYKDGDEIKIIDNISTEDLLKLKWENKYPSIITKQNIIA